uniref:Uncharacterized protein n=1 Tax=Rhizophagus irregularis (strain DAOM 181602 / DAOM 197198 / MUCL 43194) TaxID=747089 RepID=U9SMK6_RHIID
MSKCQIIYTIFLLLTLGLFLGIFFGLGYPEIKRAEYISTYCTINSKTISTKYCCYAECSNCETASELAPKCTDLESKWNSLSPDTCTNAVLTNSSLADVCPINDLKGEFVLTVTLQKRDNWSYTPITTNITTEFRENINGAEQFLADYSISSTVQCFYNPKDPFQAFLNVNFAAKTWVAVGITAFFLTITLMIGTWILFSENNTILQDYKYRVLIMEIALWCGTIIPPLLILIDLIPFTNGKVLWTLAVIGVALGWAPVHTAACMKKRGWRFISAFTVTIITLILPLIMFSIAAIYALSTDIRTYMIILAIVIPLGVNIIIFVLWDLCVNFNNKEINRLRLVHS